MFKLQPRLITSTHKDPLLPKLLEAIRKTNYIEIAVSFVQPSGISLLFEDLKEALERGATLRFLTSDYLHITHPQALRSLIILGQLGAEVKVFQCLNNINFHLKTYIFTRSYEQGVEAGSAFIGSNNISKAALTKAHEWAWRHDWEAPADSHAAIEFQAVRQAFDELFNLPETCWLTNEWLAEYQQRYSANLPALRKVVDLTSEIFEPPTPYSVQMEALDVLRLTRCAGFKRGLVVLATGMGKTFLAAFDAKQMAAERVLFVAHREEILLQAQSAFNAIHPEKSTGLFNANKKDIHADFMAEYFRNKGVRAEAVYSGSPFGRREALTQLENQQLDVIFSVDLFNEGTDIPSLDTLLMIRPTESKIVFLQQLGRGLRRSEKTNKQQVVVLDFLGNHRSFLNNPAALLGYTDSQAALNQVLRSKGDPIELAQGCYINFDPQLLDFWQQLKRNIGATAKEDYEQLTLELGHRPTATEFFYAGYSLHKVRQQHGSWLALVTEKEDDEKYSALLKSYGEFFLDAVETTRLTKSFKVYLYQAFLGLGGVHGLVKVDALAVLSRELLEHRPDRLVVELPDSVRSTKGNSHVWINYWRKNPIHYSCQQDKRSSQAWFREDEDFFGLNFTVNESLKTIFKAYFTELIELRLAEYFARTREAGK